MNEPQTQSTLEPPPNAPPVSLAFDGDDIQRIGDQIAALTPFQANVLTLYLENYHGIKMGVKR